MGAAIPVFSNQLQRRAVKPVQMKNAPSTREVLLYSSKPYQQSQFSLEDLEVDSLISTSLLLERYMGLMINLSGPCYSAQLFFFTVIRFQNWKWISKSFKYDFIFLHKEKLYLPWISPSFLLPWYTWKKSRMLQSVQLQLMASLCMMALEESPRGSFCRDALNHLIPCQPSSSLFIASNIGDCVFTCVHLMLPHHRASKWLQRFCTLTKFFLRSVYFCLHPQVSCTPN